MPQNPPAEIDTCPCGYGPFVVPGCEPYPCGNLTIVAKGPCPKCNEINMVGEREVKMDVRNPTRRRHGVIRP